MAVINAYVNANTKNVFNRGGEVIVMETQFEVAAADSDGSIYRLFKVNGNMIPVQIDINCDAITGASSYDLGLYNTLENGGAVQDANAFMSAIDISAGAAIGSEKNGLVSMTIANIGKEVYELAGDADATPEMEYDLALTANTVGSGSGTIAVRAIFVKTA
jgi:hypothetical protein